MNNNLKKFFKKIGVCLMVGSLVFGNLSFSVLADEIKTEEEETVEEPVEVSDEDVVLEITPETINDEENQDLISDALNALSDEEYVDTEENSEELQTLDSNLEFIYEFAVEADKWHIGSQHNNLNDNHYTVRGGDLNDGAGGYYIYLGYHYRTNFGTGDGLITGLLILNGNNGLNDIYYNGKTYHPVRKFYNHSNGDLNQKAGGPDLFLYYTNDGATQGAPVLVTNGFGTTSNRNNSSNVKGYVLSNNGNYVKDSQDLNEGAGGDDIFLTAQYHTHNLVVKYDGTNHWTACSECGYVKSGTTESHHYVYTNVEGSDRHTVTCANCGYKLENQFHIYTNKNDGACDLCNAKVCAVVTPGNIAFSKWEDAFTYACSQTGNVTLTTLCNTTLTNARIVKTGSNTITLAIKDNNVKLTLVDSNIAVESGKLKTDINIEAQSDVFIVRGGELETSSGNIFFRENSYSMRAVAVYNNGIYKNTGASIRSFSIQIGRRTGIYAGSDNCNIELSGGMITGFEYPIYCGAGNITIRGGVEIVGAALVNEICMLGGHLSIEGGEITCDIRNATNKTNVTIKNGKFGGLLDNNGLPVSEMLDTGVCGTVQDDNGEFTRKLDWSTFSSSKYKTTNYVIFSKCEKHGMATGTSVSSEEHKGICRYCNQTAQVAHEYDTDGKCSVCGYQAEAEIITNSGSKEFYSTFLNALSAINGRSGLKIMLLKDCLTEDIPIKDNEEITIDLNQKTLSLQRSITNIKLSNGSINLVNGNLSIRHTSLKKIDTGLNITCKKLTLNNVKVTSSTGISIENKSQVLIGENTSVDFTSNSCFYLKNGALTLSGGASITSDNECIEVSGLESASTLTILDATLNGIYPLKVSGGTVNITQAVLNSIAAYEVQICSGNYTLRKLLNSGSYYYDSNGNELDQSLVNKNSFRGKLIVKVHDPHTGYTDNKDGFTHNVDCVCGYSEKNLPHDPDYDNWICKICGGTVICIHNFDENGICQTCKHSAECYLLYEGSTNKLFFYKVADAIKNIKAHDKVTAKLVIRSDAQVTDSIVISSNEVITLASEKLSTNLNTQSDDSSSNGNMATLSADNVPVVVVDGGELIVEDITLSSSKCEALQVKSGKVNLLGGKYIGNGSSINITSSDENLNLGSLLQTGYAFADADSAEVITPDWSNKSLNKNVQVVVHNDHKGYFEEGICQACRFECPHSNIDETTRTCTLCGMVFKRKSVTVVATSESGEVSTKYYDNLQEAFDSVQKAAQATLTLNESLTPDDPQTVNITGGNITFNFNGFVTNQPFTISGGNTTVKLIGSNNNEISAASGSAITVDKASVALENCSATTTDAIEPAISVNGGKIEINGGAYSGPSAITVSGATAVINSGIFNGTAGTDVIYNNYSCISVIDGSTAEISGGTFKMAAGNNRSSLRVLDSTVTLKGGSFEGDSVRKNKYYSITSGRGSVVTLGSDCVLLNSDGSDVTSQYARSGSISSIFESVSVKEDNSFSEGDTFWVSTVYNDGSTDTGYFNDFDIAVEFASDGLSATITLNADYFDDNAQPVEISSGNITLDFKNHSSNAPLIISGEDINITIKGEKTGGIKVSSGNAITVNGAKLTLQGGTFSGGDYSLYADNGSVIKLADGYRILNADDENITSKYVSNGLVKSSITESITIAAETMSSASKTSAPKTGNERFPYETILFAGILGLAVTFLVRKKFSKR